MEYSEKLEKSHGTIKSLEAATLFYKQQVDVLTGGVGTQLAGQVEGERGRQEGEGGEGGVGEVFALLGTCRRVHVVVCRVELHQVPLS